MNTQNPNLEWIKIQRAQSFWDKGNKSDAFEIINNELVTNFSNPDLWITKVKWELEINNIKKAYVTAKEFWKQTKHPYAIEIIILTSNLILESHNQLENKGYSIEIVNAISNYYSQIFLQKTITTNLAQLKSQIILFGNAGCKALKKCLSPLSIVCNPF